MGDLFAPTRKKKSTGGGNSPSGGGLFGPLNKKKKSAETDIADLDALAEQTGATTIGQRALRLGGGVLDVLSRPNYAIAGVAEELLTERGGGIGAAVSRAGRELFSGIGSVKGEKEGFGQVLEQSGVGPGGELHMLAPFLYSDTGDGWKFQRGGPMDWTGRGLGGFVLDVALDPLTYLGGTGVLRKVGQGGLTTLSKAGTKAFGAEFTKALGDKALKAEAIGVVKGAELAREAAERLRVPVGPLPAAAATRASTQIARELATPGTEAYSVLRGLAEKEAESRILTAAKTAPHLLDQGGIHWLGNTIPGTPEIATAMSGVSDWATTALGQYTFGAAALKTAAEGRKVLAALPNLFVPGWNARNLPGFRDLFRDVNNKTSMETGRYLTTLGEHHAAHAFKPDALKRIAVAVDEGKIHTLTDQTEREAATFFAGEGRKMYRDDQVAGIIYQAEDNYLHHLYDNTPEEFARVRDLVQFRTPMLGASERFTMDRTFKTLREAEEWSIQAHKLDPSIPILKPIYDPYESLRRRATLSIKARNFREFERELVSRYGEASLRFNAADAFDLTGRPARQLTPKEQKTVAEILAAPSQGEARRTFEMTKQVTTPELRLAEEKLKRAWDDFPMEYSERQVVKNLDEVSYFRRRGWDVVEEGDGKWTAYRLTKVTPRAQYSARLEVERASKAVSGARERAERTFTASIPATKALDKVSEVAKLSDEGKRAFMEDRLLMAKSPREVFGILHKYEKFEPHFPKATGWKGQVAADGTPFIGVKLKSGTFQLPKSLVDTLAYVNEPLLQFQGPEGNAFKQLLRGYDWINNTFKLSVTAWPAFHVRNAYSNVAQSFVDVGAAIFDPRIRHNSIAMLMGREGVWKTPAGDYSISELRKIFEDRGVIVPGKSLMEYTGREASGTAMRRGIERWQRTIGGSVENEARVSHALALLRQGHSIDDAVRRVNKFLFDYSSLTWAEKNVFRRAFPFWTWQSRNMALQAENLLRNPGRLANEIKPFRGREEEDRELTSWDGQAFKLRLNNDGKTLTTITGIDLPIRNLDVIWRGSWQSTWSGVLGMLSPVAKLPIEVGTGNSLFLGKPFDRKESTVIGHAIEPLPKAVKDWMGYRKDMDEAGRPHYTFDGEKFYALFQSGVTSRFVSTSDRQFRRYMEDDDWVGIFADVIGGLRYNEWDLEEERARMIKERKRQLEEALVKRGVMRNYRKAYTPKQGGELE